MERFIHSRSIVFGLPTVIFLMNVAFTLFSRELVAITSPWMHLAGGFSMGLFFLYFWEQNLRLPDSGKNFLFFLIAVTAFATLIGVLWEFAEFLYDKLFPEIAALFPTQPSPADTMVDLFLDFLGGLLVSFFYSSKFRIYKESALSR